MFGLLSRPARTGRSPARRTPKLRVENLETRDCPAAPILNTFNIEPAEGANGQIQVTGRITDEHPGTAVLQISGAAATQVTVDGKGNFYVNLPAFDPGTLSAVVTDDEGLSSNAVSSDWTGAGAPQIAIDYALAQSNSKVIVFGRLTGIEDLSNQTIEIDGAAAGQVTTDRTGHFTTTLGVGQFGNLRARLVGAGPDWHFNAYMDNAPPRFTDFQVLTGYGMIIVTGHVWDEYAPGLQVRLTSDLPAFNGLMCDVGADGQFSASWTIPMGFHIHGYFRADVIDWFGATGQYVEGVL